MDTIAHSPCRRCGKPIEGQSFLTTFCAQCSEDFEETALVIRKTVGFYADIGFGHAGGHAEVNNRYWPGNFWEEFGRVIPADTTLLGPGASFLYVRHANEPDKWIEAWEMRVSFEGCPLFLRKSWRPSGRQRLMLGGLEQEGWTEDDRTRVLSMRRMFDVLPTIPRPGRPRKITAPAQIQIAYRRLRKLRYGDVSQEDLAGELGVSLSTLQRRLNSYGLSWPPV